jgi:hypothetical protein
VSVVTRLPDLTPCRTTIVLPPGISHAMIRMMPGQIVINGFGYVSEPEVLPTNAVSFLFTPQSRLGAVVTKRIRRGEHPLCLVEKAGVGFHVNITFEPDLAQEDERLAVEEWQRLQRELEGHR